MRAGGAPGGQQFGIHAARAHGSFAAAELAEIQGRHVVDMVHDRRVGLLLGIGGQHAGRRGQIDEQVRARKVDQQAGEAVVVAELELAYGNRVVFIDNGQHAPLQEFREGVAGVEKALAGAQVVAGQQHLGRGHAVGVKSRVPGPHQLALAHGGGGLPGRQARGFHLPAVHGQGRPPGGHGAGRNQYQPPLAGQIALRTGLRAGRAAQPGQLPGQAVQHGGAEPLGVGQHGAAYLDHHHTGLCQHTGPLLPPILRPFHHRLRCNCPHNACRFRPGRPRFPPDTPPEQSHSRV